MPSNLKAKHPNPACLGYGHSISSVPEALNRMLRLESAGLQTLTPTPIGQKVMLVAYSENCPECQFLAYREIRRRLVI